MTACSTTSQVTSSDTIKLFTPSSSGSFSPRVSVISTEVRERPIAGRHFVPAKGAFQITLPKRLSLKKRNPKPSQLRLAAATTRSETPIYCMPAASPKPRLDLKPIQLPTTAMQRTVPARDDFYVTLGTCIVDPEKPANWTNAAVYPQVPTTQDLPVMRILGQSARSIDHVQVAPGFFWWASDSCCVSFSVPVRVMGTASDWGVLLALNY